MWKYVDFCDKKKKKKKEFKTGCFCSLLYMYGLFALIGAFVNFNTVLANLVFHNMGPSIILFDAPFVTVENKPSNVDPLVNEGPLTFYVLIRFHKPFTETGEHVSHPWTGALSSFFIFPKKISSVLGSLFAPISVRMRAFDTSDERRRHVTDKA